MSDGTRRYASTFLSHKRTGLTRHLLQVESLGVTMILVASAGTTMELFDEGLKVWRKKYGRK